MCPAAQEVMRFWAHDELLKRSHSEACEHAMDPSNDPQLGPLQFEAILTVRLQTLEICSSLNTSTHRVLCSVLQS